MATRASNFAGPVALVVSTDQTLFTVPAGHRYLVRLIRLCVVGSTGPSTCVWGINGTTSPFRLGTSGPILASTMFTDSSWFCVNAGDSLEMRLNTGGVATDVLVAGYDLEL